MSRQCTKHADMIRRTLKLDADAVGHALDALSPQCLVELRVDADVLGAHRLLRKVDDRLDSVRRPLLERTTMHALVQVHSIFARYNILQRRPRLAL